VLSLASNLIHCVLLSSRIQGTVQFADTKHFNVIHSSYSFSAGGHLFLPFCLLQWIAPLEAPHQIQWNEQASSVVSR
ncbi:Os04g0483450, partial [Oryza sativa Japonica Group]